MILNMIENGKSKTIYQNDDHEMDTITELFSKKTNTFICYLY
jgi:hypothetical protein